MEKSLNKLLKKIVLLYLIIPIVISVCLYPVFPRVLGYSSNITSISFDSELNNFSYIKQYILFFLVVLIFSLLMLLIRLKIVYKDFKKLYTNNQKNNKEIISTLLTIRKFCYGTPMVLYFWELILPLFLLPIIIKLNNMHPLAILKVWLICFSTYTISSVVSFVFSKKQFDIILNIINDKYQRYIQIIEQESSDKKSFFKSLPFKLFLEISPLVLISILLISLEGWVQINKKTGNIYYDVYEKTINQEFSDKKFFSINEIKNEIKNIKLLDETHRYFTIDANENYEVSDNSELSDFFVRYAIEKSEDENGHIYDYYSQETEGIVVKCYLENGNYYFVGIKFDTTQSEYFKFIVFVDFIIFVFISIIIMYITISLTKEIKTVSNKLKVIAISNKENIDLNNDLVVTSEDEIADLIMSYNLIQNYTKKNISQLHKNQDKLMEQERLASLGQLIGGISHNLKTPIMSISGATEGLKDLIDEYDTSIEDKEVTNEDHHEIAKEMNEWIEKIKSYTSYMSDIITAVKGQAINLSSNDNIDFTISELLKKVNILMKHELKKSFSTLEIKCDIDENTIIKGDVNGLVQVVNNLISNAIQAYKDKENNLIELKIDKDDENIIISVKDYASGMSKAVQNKLFKEMITTKGKNGSGLGLLMSYSTIKAYFNGNITFESELKKGTTFYIKIPK